MRFGRLNPAIVVLGLVVIVSTPAMASATDPDWKAVEQALGKSGQLHATGRRGSSFPRRRRAWTRDKAARGGARTFGARDWRRRVPDPRTPRGSDHRDGVAVTARHGRDDSDELPADGGWEGRDHR